MAAFGHIGGAEPSTITFKIATVTQTRNSSAMHQEILSIGDPESSLALAAVVNTGPASTAWGVVTRVAGTVDINTVAGTVQVSNAALNRTWDGAAASADKGVAALAVRKDTPVALAIAADFYAPLQTNSSGELYVKNADALSVAWTAGQISSAMLAGNSSALRVRNVWSSTNADQPVSAAQSGTWNVGTVTTVSSLAGAVIMRSSKADALVTVYQSTASELQATVTPVAGSTWNVRPIQSSAADLQATVTPAAGSTWTTRPIQSSQADLRVTVYQSTGTDLNVTVSNFSTAVLATLAGNLQSTSAPSSNSSGLIVRQVIDGLTTFASTSALSSTSVEVASSAANIRHYVTAYSITSTNQTPAQWGFFSSNGTLLWPLTLAALSSATCGANLAVSPPGYLFRTTASDALNFKTGGSTVSAVQLAVSYFRAP